MECHSDGKKVTRKNRGAEEGGEEISSSFHTARSGQKQHGLQEMTESFNTVHLSLSSPDNVEQRNYR